MNLATSLRCLSSIFIRVYVHRSMRIVCVCYIACYMHSMYELNKMPPMQYKAKNKKINKNRITLDPVIEKKWAVYAVRLIL